MDIALQNNNFSYDLAFKNGDFVKDTSLESAIIVSLFTDKYVPENEKDKRGWWADETLPVEGDKIGSKLWLLSREKELKTVLSKAEEYAFDALKWLIEDELIKNIQVYAENNKTGKISLIVQVFKFDEQINFKYLYDWKN